jgi:hypothetical protein
MATHPLSAAELHRTVAAVQDAAAQGAVPPGGRVHAGHRSAVWAAAAALGMKPDAVLRRWRAAEARGLTGAADAPRDGTQRDYTPPDVQTDDASLDEIVSILAAEQACQEAARLLVAGVKVYSPIAHSHPIAEHGHIDPYSHAIWLNADAPMMECACGMIQLRASCWDISFGMEEERKFFAGRRLPIIPMTPGVVPEELVEG